MMENSWQLLRLMNDGVPFTRRTAQSRHRKVLLALVHVLFRRLSLAPCQLSSYRQLRLTLGSLSSIGITMKS